MSDIKAKPSKSKKIDRETLDVLMIDSFQHSFSKKAENVEETVISLSDVMRLWNKISDYEETNTALQGTHYKKEEFKKLVDEAKTIFLGQTDDKA